jgi:dTDP-glucose 4,6-dehydratase
MGKGQESVEYVEDRKGHDLRYSVDITKISNELGYAPQVDWEVGLKETIHWYQENEAWWRPLKK